MFKRDPNFRKKVTFKNTAFSVLYNIVLAGMMIFAIYVVGINHAPILNRIVFYIVWSCLMILGLFVMVSYCCYMIVKLWENKNTRK